MELISDDNKILQDSLKLLKKFLKNIDDPNKPPINLDLVNEINKKYMLLSNTNMSGGFFQPSYSSRLIHEKDKLNTRYIKELLVNLIKKITDLTAAKKDAQKKATTNQDLTTINSNKHAALVELNKLKEEKCKNDTEISKIYYDLGKLGINYDGDSAFYQQNVENIKTQLESYLKFNESISEMFANIKSFYNNNKELLNILLEFNNNLEEEETRLITDLLTEIKTSKGDLIYQYALLTVSNNTQEHYIIQMVVASVTVFAVEEINKHNTTNSSTIDPQSLIDGAVKIAKQAANAQLTSNSDYYNQAVTAGIGAGLYIIANHNNGAYISTFDNNALKTGISDLNDPLKKYISTNIDNLLRVKQEVLTKIDETKQSIDQYLATLSYGSIDDFKYDNIVNKVSNYFDSLIKSGDMQQSIKPYNLHNVLATQNGNNPNKIDNYINNFIDLYDLLSITNQNIHRNLPEYKNIIDSCNNILTVTDFDIGDNLVTTDHDSVTAIITEITAKKNELDKLQATQTTLDTQVTTQQDTYNKL